MFSSTTRSLFDGRRNGESANPIDLLPLVLIAGNFLPFRLKTSPKKTIALSYFVDSSKLYLISGGRPLAHPLLRFHSAVKQRLGAERP
jgi:hypothetical protein